MPKADKFQAAASGTDSGISTIKEGSYVTVVDRYKAIGDAASGPLHPGIYGIVIMDDKSQVPFKVDPPSIHIYLERINIMLNNYFFIWIIVERGDIC